MIKDKGKGKSSNKKTADKPSAQLVATWNKGDDTMEPSTKMMALIELLKSWNATGDKCICYSQCALHILSYLIIWLTTAGRDINVGSGGKTLLPLWNSAPPI